MSFSIAYNIHAIDQFSKVSNRIMRNIMRLNAKVLGHDKSVKMVTKSYEEMGIAGKASSVKAVAGLQKVERQARKTKDSLSKMDKDFDMLGKVGGRMEAVGRDMTTRVTMPIIGAGVAASKFAIDFETAMVEVTKVTDAAVSKKLSGAIRQMSKEIPLANTAIAGIAADAARFGIRGPENIESFTRAVAKMSIATDLSANQAGVALAKIQAQTDLSATTASNLGSAINELSNNFATSSSEIVDAMLRSSAAASNFGLSAQEIIGLAAQMNALSESAERAGTRMRTLMNELMDPKKAEKYAGAIGLTVQEFKSLRKESPIDALMAFVDVINEGGAASDKLREEISMVSIQALTALGKNTDETRRAMDMAYDSFKKNTSLQKEFSAVIDTSAAKMRLTWNRIKDLGIVIGNKLLPIVERFLEMLDPWIDKLSKMSDESIWAAIKIAGVVAAIGPLLLIVGKLASAVSFVAGAIGGAGGLTAVLAMLTGPVGIVAGAILGLAATIAYCWDELKPLRDILRDEFLDLFGQATTKGSGLADTFKALGGIVRWSVGMFAKLIAPVAKLVVKFHTLPIRWIITGFKIIGKVFRVVSAVLKILGNAFKFAYNWIKETLLKMLGSSEAGQSVINAFSKIKDAIGEVIGFLDNLWGKVTGFFESSVGWLERLGMKTEGIAAKQQLAASMAGGLDTGGGVMNTFQQFTALSGESLAAAGGYMEIDVNLNAPEGAVESVKSKTTNKYAKLNMGKNTP